jgi:hypothetical protein
VVVQQSAVGHQAGVGGLAGAHPVGKPVNHLAHWAGVHGSLLDASDLDNGALIAYLTKTQDEDEEEEDKP